MNLKNSNNTYGSIAKFLHWIIFLLVLIIIPLGYLMGDIPDKALRGQVINIHKLIGLSILTLMVLRMAWALSNVKPALPFNTPLWQKSIERILQVLFYVGLIVMPLSGWVGSVAGGRPPHIGSIFFNLPIAQNKALSQFAFDYIHVPLAVILIVLISIHILAALYHRFIKKDNVLRRMLPGGGS